MAIFFSVPYNFGTELQPENAEASMGDETTSVELQRHTYTLCLTGTINTPSKVLEELKERDPYHHVSLMSIRDQLVLQSSISTFDLQPCQTNILLITQTHQCCHKLPLHSLLHPLHMPCIV